MPSAERPLLLSVFATFATGGPQVRFAAYANRMGAAWRHAVVAIDGVTSCRERLDPALDVDFPTLDLPKGDLFGTLRRIRAALRVWRPHTLLTHNWGSIEWALANSWPRRLVHHIHAEDGFGPEERDRQLPRRVWTRRLGLRRTTVLLPSLTLMHLARTVWRLDPRRLAYVPNGIDLARFATPSKQTNTPVIGTVAALRPEKNIARLLRAMATIAEARLLVVGDGPERPALVALAEQLGIAGRVTFAGHMADPASAYRRIDVFALSSDTEQMPLSVLEAMAAGLPVVATDVGDVAAMLDASNRPFVVARDDTMLAGALSGLLADLDLRRRVGRANRARVEREFDQAQMFAAWDALLRRPAEGTLTATGPDRPATRR